MQISKPKLQEKFASIMNECEKWFANDREYLHIYSSGKKIILKKDSVLYIKKGKEIYTKDFCVCSNDVVELVSESNFFTNKSGCQINVCKIRKLGMFSVEMMNGESIDIGLLEWYKINNFINKIKIN